MKPVMDRCAELRAGLQLLRSSKDDEAKAKELEIRRRELDAVSKGLTVVALSAHVLLQHERIARSSLPDCSKALESCSKVEVLLESDPFTITKGRSYKNFLQRAEKVINQLKKINEDAWQAVTSQHAIVDDEFLRRVELFPGQAQAVARIRELKGQYEESIATVPVNTDAYARFEARYLTLQQELAKLDPEAFPDDVLTFFRAAQQPAGAPLSLFTDSVRSWLEKNDFLGGVHIRFTGAK